MKVLHLLASPYWTGPAENVAWLALAQREQGHEVSVAIDRKRQTAPAEELAAPRLQALGLLDARGLELSVKSSPLAMLADVRRLARTRVDVVHAHFSHDHFLARWGGREGRVLVRSVHAARSLRRSLPRADGFTVFSSNALASLVGQRAVVLPPLLDPAFVPAADRVALRAELGLSGAPVIGMVSTFQPSRRHDVGLEAFARLRAERPDARWVLVGDGGLVPEIRAQVEGRGLSGAVTFAGYRSGPEFVRWLQALDEVWVLGLGNDWSGRVAAQARACGVRVVAVDEGGLAPNADALLPAADPAQLVAASLGESRASQPLPSNAEIAARVLALYERCRR